jgi:hypothetical protein
LRFEFIPNSRRNHIRINSCGFRGRDYPYVPSEGANRIVFLGDSETFGASLKEDETITGCLEYILNNKHPKKQYEVLNFGFPGYNTLQESRLLHTKVINFSPAIVILYYVFNDPIFQHNVVRLEKRTILYSSYLYLLMKRCYDLYLTKRDIVSLYKDLHGPENFAKCQMLINRTSDFLHEKGIRFIIVIAPEILGYNDFDSYPYKDIHEKLKSLSSDQLEVVDPFHALQDSGCKPTDFWIHLTDWHKNKKANMIIAEEISRHIEKEL